MTIVLMIDDDADVIATLREHFSQHAQGATFIEESDFGNALNKVREVRPDVLILDVYQGNPATGNVAVQPVWADIWKDWFCPLVFYSAGDVDVDPAPPEGHPFICMIQKGAGTEQQVLNAVNEYAPHVAAIRSVQQELSNVTHSVLRDIAKHVFDTEPQADRRKDMLVRVARRRVAAKMDEALTGTTDPLYPWEQYVHPPLASHLILGDILRVTDMPQTDTTAFRIVITPTCDLVPHGQPPKCKVDAVLAVKSSSPTTFVTKGLNLATSTAEKKLKDYLGRALNDPQQSGVAVLPEYPGVLPLLALDFRELELIPVADIALANEAGKPLTRVASIDSPFREFLAWAFLQTNCRPGIPPRNMESVVAALVTCCKPTTATDGAS
jgi:hypothetical protein